MQIGALRAELQFPASLGFPLDFPALRLVLQFLNGTMSHIDVVDGEFYLVHWGFGEFAGCSGVVGRKSVAGWESVLIFISTSMSTSTCRLAISIDRLANDALPPQTRQSADAGWRQDESCKE
jgi:hypothetical protein